MDAPSSTSSVLASSVPHEKAASPAPKLRQSPGWKPTGGPAARRSTLSGSPQYNTIGLSPGQAPNAFGAGIYGLAIEGYILDYLPAYYLTHFAAGQPASAAVILRHVFSRAARLPAGATLSRAVAGVAAAGPSTFALLKNGTAIGEIQFAAGAAAASFAVAAAVDFAAGDVFAIAAPDPQDATLADIALTLVFGFV